MKQARIFDFIGKTPLIQTTGLIQKKHVSLFLKLEGNNPAGSVKDRPAYNMIAAAIERKELTKDMRLIEATSGNTGIALAMIAKQFNISIELVMPENATMERIQTMRAYGAKVILTSSDSGIEGSRAYAEHKSKQDGYLMLDQFANPDNWKAHYNHTGPEIWNATHGKISHLVSAMGTTGTIMGCSTFLKEKNTNIQIIGAQPAQNARIPGIRKWSPEFLPKIFDPNKVDQIFEVSEEEARIMTRRLALEEGVFSGMSGGGAVVAALKLAEALNTGTLVAIIPDRGDRYLSSDLFE